jgi:hypothetical protein
MDWYLLLGMEKKKEKRKIKLSLTADRHYESGLSLQWCHIPRGEKWRTPGCGSYSVPPGIFVS